MSKPLMIKALSEYLQSQELGGEVCNLQRITIGANKEVWRFDLQQDNTKQAFILKRHAIDQAEYRLPSRFGKTDIQSEADLIRKLVVNGLKVPKIIARFQQGSTLGDGFIMSFENGESAPRRVLSLENLQHARSKLAAECGEQLAALHALPVDDSLSKLPKFTLTERLDRIEHSNKTLNNSSAAHALAYRWLRANIPASSKQCLVHGDFRLGNLLVDEHGLSSIVDWEFARLSTAAEDLGYLTANTSRFGYPDNPVGGFGQYEQLFDAYERVAGWRPDLSTVLYWQLFTAVSWGVICLSMQEMYLSGQDRSGRRLAVARRFSESEVDILMLLDELE